MDKKKTIEIPDRKVSPQEEADKKVILKDLGSCFGAVGHKVESRKATPLILKPEDKHQKRLHPEDFKALSTPAVSKENSIFSWETMNLEIEGIQIKLTPIEKNICSKIFHDPSLKVLSLDKLERALYEEIVPDSKRMAQVFKRINKKVREAGFDNIFSWARGSLSIEI